MVLNDAQKKLVEENHNLIYSYMHSRKLKEDDLDDWYGTLAIALCKAAVGYDETLGYKFSPYAYTCMDNEVRKVMNSKTSIPDREVLSLDYELENTKDLCLLGCLADPVDYTRIVYFKDALDNVISSTKQKHVDMVKMGVQDGLSCTEIAEKLGVTKQSVSAAQIKFMKDLHEQLKEN